MEITETGADQSIPKTSLRTVINQVTKEKLAWLESQRTNLKSHFQPILDKYENPENKASFKFLGEIHAALKCYTGAENPAVGKRNDLTVFMNWINLEEPDEMVYFGSKHLVRHWIEVLIRKIRFQIERCEYSCLYANVMTQYMDRNAGATDEEIGEENLLSSGSEQTNKEKTIQEFSERIFTAPSDFKREEFEQLLNSVLFNMEDPIHKAQLLNARKRIQDFCKHFHNSNCINTSDLKHCIDGLLAEDLLGSEKAVTLKELRENDDALQEVVTLLDNRLKNFNSWGWAEPVHVDFRRNMAGRYRAYMDEDIITAIFLHFVGAKWSILFKSVYKSIYTSKMWKRGTGTIGDLYYNKKSIEGFRRSFHEKSFLSILPTRMKDLASTGYDDNDKKNGNDNELTPIQIKQKLLHLISNEIQLNNVIRPDTPITVAQTDMEWFGPSIVHEAVFSLMKFFGVSEQWMSFFRKFLECPLKVGSRNAPVQVRKRGVPMSHLLSTLFGESLLFTMDLYVNQISGLSLYRIHDDFWFWSHNSEMVKKAWQSINTFVSLSGLKLNEEKSASVVCKSSDDLKNSSSTIIHGEAPLPQRQVKWGFLVLHSDGIFRISQELLQPHVMEMREYLEKSDVIMNWVHCHNRYIRFFIRNFAEPSITFGKQHIEQILKALHSILKTVHKEADGDTVEALKLKFIEIWKDKDVMDSWVHWPVEEGGLSLYNPFLDLIPLHEAYRKSEEQNKVAGYTHKFGKVVDDDKAEWSQALVESKKRRKKRCSENTSEEMDEETVTDLEESDSENDDESDTDNADMGNYKKKGKGKRFKNGSRRISFDTWCTRNRETRWSRWHDCYSELLNKIDAEEPQDIDASNWTECLYSSQLEDKLGNADGFIDTNLIPLSLISSMQASRVHKN